MIVKITAQWGATPYFDAGECQFEIEWKHHIIPLVGNVIRLASFIQNSTVPNQTFTYNSEETNIFSFIENEQQWKVQQIEWERNGNDFISHVLVTDTYEAIP